MNQFVVRRCSDGRFYAPTSTTNWRWHRRIEHAYVYSIGRKDQVLKLVEECHRDNWRYDNLPEQDLFVIQSV